MAEYTQVEIERLISCPKNVQDPPRRQGPKLVDADYRNDMKLAASNQGPENPAPGEFTVFMRQSEDFPENFSIGLTYHPNDGRQEITLVRCNGKHGIFNSRTNFNPDHAHWDFHIHRADAALLDVGFKAEKIAQKTTEYASYEEALPFFLKMINLDDRDVERYFPSEAQSNFFE